MWQQGYYLYGAATTGEVSSQSFPRKVIELGRDYESSWCRAVQSCLFYIIYQHQIIFHN